MNYHWIQLQPLPRAPNSSSDPSWLALATPLAQLTTPLGTIYHTHTSDKPSSCRPRAGKGCPHAARCGCMQEILTAFCQLWGSNQFIISAAHKLAATFGRRPLHRYWYHENSDFSLQKALLGVIRILTRRSSHVKGGLKEHFLSHGWLVL